MTWNTRLKAIGVLTSVILLHWVWLYIWLYFYSLRKFRPFMDRVLPVSDYLDIAFGIFLVSAGFWLLKRWAPEVLETSRQRITASRSATFLGFSGIRKAIVIAALFLPFFWSIGKLIEWQAKVVGVRYEEVREKIPDSQEVINDTESGDISDDHSAAKMITETFGTTLVSVFSEELIYRFFLLRVLLGLMPMWAATVLSSLVFGVAHMPARLYDSWAFATHRILSSTFSGLYLGVAYTKVGLLASTIFHAWNNLGASLVGEEIVNLKVNVYVCLYLFILPLMLLGLGISALIRVHKRRKKLRSA